MINCQVELISFRKASLTSSIVEYIALYVQQESQWQKEELQVSVGHLNAIREAILGVVSGQERPSSLPTPAQPGQSHSYCPPARAQPGSCLERARTSPVLEWKLYLCLHAGRTHVRACTEPTQGRPAGLPTPSQ